MPQNYNLICDLVWSLRLIAGSNRGATPERLYLERSLRYIARPDKSKRPREQGEQILEFLKIEIGEWQDEIVLRGVKLSARQCQRAWSVLLNLEATDSNSEDRRLEAIKTLGLKRCGWECWRKKVEAEFLEHLAAHIVELYVS
jgi:hypothetical protein